MKKKIFSSLITLVLISIAHAVPVTIDNPLDYQVLDRFFRTMIDQSEYGYVIENAKPISVIDISLLENLAVPNSNYFSQKINDVFDMNSGEQLHELLFINKSKLKKTIESNINLFRYVLGPCIDADFLTIQIIESSQSLYSLLKEDRVLIGIVLGYGAYNSLMHARVEFLQNCCNVEDTPPYFRRNFFKFDDLNAHTYQMFCLSPFSHMPIISSSNTIQNTSRGFCELKEECKVISSNHIDLPHALLNQKPQFIFSSYKSPETNQLIEELKVAQANIQAFLKCPDFLELVLEKITGERPIINCNTKTNPRHKLNGNIEAAVAKVIWKTYSQLDDWTFSYFVDAFVKCEPSDRVRPKLNLLPGTLSGLEQARHNLKEAEMYLESCSKDELFQVAIPNGVYFKRLSVGDGYCIDSDVEVVMSYLIENSNGRMLAANHNCRCYLSELIPGLVMGMRNMKEKETRKIFIHPAYAYGVSTTLPPCSLLVATITLDKINPYYKKELPDLEKLDLEWIKKPSIFQEIQQATIQLARSLGSIWGIWVASNLDLNFEKLSIEIKNLAEKGNANLEISLEERQTCFWTFWNSLCDIK